MYGFSDGSAVVLEDAYKLTFPNDQRVLIPQLKYPFGTDPLQVDPQGRALRQVTVQPGSSGASGAVIAALTVDDRLVMARVRTRQSFLGGAAEAEVSARDLGAVDPGVTAPIVSTDLSNIIAHDDAGRLHYFNIDDRKPLGLADSAQAVADGADITQLRFLNGSKSWIVGGSDGSLTQWMLVRQDDNRFTLTPDAQLRCA